MEDEKYIAITHFVNPHQFYYTCLEDDTYNELHELEERLNKRYMNNFSLTTQHFTPVEGSLVAVHYFPNNKGFIRARVEEKISKQYTKSASYIVWAIDYGFPFEAEEEHIRYLPEELSNNIDLVRCGGIAKIVPAEEDFDFINQRTVLEAKNKWSNYACDTLEKMLTDAASTAFSEKFQTNNGHYWGDLHIVNHQGLLFRASDYLINEKLALKTAEKFKELCIKSNCTQAPTWRSSRGNAKYGTNKYSNIETVPHLDDGACLLNKNDFQTAKLKVAAWSTHNKKATNYSDQSISGRPPSAVTSNLCDTDIDDSVSISGCKEDDLLTNKGFHKRIIKHTPPEAELTDFTMTEEALMSDLFEDSVSLDNITSVSRQQQVEEIEKVPAANKHSKHLLELRKKQMSKQKGGLTHDMDCSSVVAIENNRNNDNSIEYSVSDTNTPCLERRKNLEPSADKTEYRNKSAKESSSERLLINRAELVKSLHSCNKSDVAEKINASSVAASPKPTKQKTCMQPSAQNMFPAGFDLANLNEYKDKNHWHRKNTTRNSNDPHNTSYTCDSENQNQDFRFTRPNTEKYKPYKDDTKILELNTKLSPEEKKAQLPVSVKMKPSTDKNLSAIAKTLLPKEIHSKKVMDKANLFSTSPKYSDSNFNDSKSAVLSDSSEDSVESRYSSARSCMDPDSQDEFHLKTTQRIALQQIKGNIIPQPKIENVKTHKYEISKNRSNILNHNTQRDRENISISHQDDNILRTKFVEHLVLAHSQIQLYTAENFNNVFLAPTVTAEMKRMFINKVYRIQSYAWSHMIGGNGLFIVNAPNSGKTWSYIPPLCSSITFAIQNSIVPSTYGPMAIIIVPSADHATEVGNTCSRILSKLNALDGKTVISYGLQNLTNTKIQLMEACAVLVTTPSNLLRLMQDNDLKDPLFDRLRIQHIVIDDLDIILSRSEQDFVTVLKKLFTLVPKDKKTKKIQPQLVVTSSLYQIAIKKLIPISNQPLLLIGDFLEAAVYGKTNILIKLCPKTEKITFILQFIKKHPIQHEPLIILCNSEGDVLYIVEKLITNGILTIGFHSKSLTSTRQQIEDWKAQPYPLKVLVCSDGVFPELEIQSAQNLIHYSLAKTWSKFTLRFISLLNTHENLVVKGFDGPPPEKRATSLVLLDEDNNTELPRLIEFLKNHNQIDRVPPDVLELSKRIIMQREVKRCSDSTQLCSALFQFGECNNSRCEYRHVLVLADVKQNNNEILQYGDVRLLILNVFSPTHFSARILEHRATPLSKWRVVRQSNKAATFAIRLNSFYYLNPNNLNIHWPAQIKDLCVCKKNGTFYRARVLAASEIKAGNVIQSVQIKLKLIDTGDIIHAKSDEIYVCHDRFRDFPAQAVDIRLMGVLPFDNESVWDSITTKHVNRLIKENLRENECVHASIDFALDDAIWVNNVVVMQDLPTIKNNAYNVNLKRHLVDKKYGIMDKSVVTKIHNIIEEQGFGYILDKTEMSNSADTSIKTVNSEIKLMEASEEQSTAIKELEEQTPAFEIKQKKLNSQSKENYNHIPISSAYDVNMPEKINIENAPVRTNKSSSDADKKIKRRFDIDPLPDVCDFKELVMCIQRSMKLDAEEFDIQDDRQAESIKEYIRETEELCKAAINNENTQIDEIKNNENNVKQRKTTKISAINSKENVVKTEKNESEKWQQKTSLPRLANLHSRPKTVWYETNYFIILSIHAPEIDDYYLEVSQSYLYFTTYVAGVKQVLILNFFGTIEPSLVSHEIRGLNCVVRLVKSLYMKWPRLLQQKEKQPWLTYDFNMLNTKEMEEILPQQLLGSILHTRQRKPFNSSDEDSIDSDDNEYDFYETFTPIVNKEDIHDPIASELI